MKWTAIKGFLDGKKSYIVSVVIFVLGGLQAVGVNIPTEVYAILGSLLGASLRAGIGKVE
jgi:hypothetical protein